MPKTILDTANDNLETRLRRMQSDLSITYDQDESKVKKVVPVPFSEVISTPLGLGNEHELCAPDTDVELTVGRAALRE